MVNIVTAAEQAELDERRLKAIEMKRRAMPWEYIAGQLGYLTAQHAAADVLGALERRRKESARQLDAYVQLELEKLDTLERAMYKIMQRKHILVQQGKVMINPDTHELIEDDAPHMQAVDRIVKIMERRAKMLGLDSAMKLDMRVSDETNAKIEELLASYQKELDDPRRLEILAPAGEASPAEKTPRQEEPRNSENQREEIPE